MFPNWPSIGRACKDFDKIAPTLVRRAWGIYTSAEDGCTLISQHKLLHSPVSDFCAADAGSLSQALGTTGYDSQGMRMGR